jgi:hypothetical protein
MIPGMRPCAAPSGAQIEQRSSSTRIDLVPSLRAATLAAIWLFVVCGALVGTVALPLLARIGLCIAIATPGLAAIRGCVLLKGRKAVHTLDWSRGWRVGIGSGGTETPVTLRTGSFRVGRAFLLLWVQSRDGIHAVLIDGGRQEPIAFRRLCRQLRWPVAPS